MNRYPDQDKAYASTGAQNAQAIPREVTHLERLMNEIESLSSRAAELCGNISTHANRLCGERPANKAPESGVRAIGPGGALGELFAKVESIASYVEQAHSEMARIRRSV